MMMMFEMGRKNANGGNEEFTGKSIGLAQDGGVTNLRDGLATGKMERTSDVINHSNKGVQE